MKSTDSAEGLDKFSATCPTLVFATLDPTATGFTTMDRKAASSSTTNSTAMGSTTLGSTTVGSMTTSSTTAVGSTTTGSVASSTWLVNGRDVMLPYPTGRSTARPHLPDDSGYMRRRRDVIRRSDEDIIVRGGNDGRLPWVLFELSLGEETAAAVSGADGETTGAVVTSYMANYKNSLRNKGLKLEELFGRARKERACKEDESRKEYDDDDIILPALMSERQQGTDTSDKDDSDNTLSERVARIVGSHNNVPRYRKRKRRKKLGEVVSPRKLSEMLEMKKPLKMENRYNYYM